MKYSTNDLSRILGVSGNTIRRFDAKGYLTGDRNEENGYRMFEYADLEKLMYVSRYRKEELSHETAALLLESSDKEIIEVLKKKREEVQRSIARFEAIDHLLKDDILLMQRAGDMLWKYRDIECQSAHYILYSENDKLLKDKEREKALQDFMVRCPEFYYFYMFKKEDVENRRLGWSSGVGSNVIMTEKYEVEAQWPIELYEKRRCIVRFVRTPILNDDEWDREEKDIVRIYFDEPMEYIRDHGLRLSGNVMGLKIGCFKDEGRLWQYILLHYPVEEA